MAKDPAFLFYSKDWLQGTADLFPEEKGVYIDLLCHQHQTGGLPIDERRLARIVGLGMDEFIKIWENIKHKFNQKDNHLVNQKLEQVANDRANHKPKKTASACLAGLISSSKLSKKQKEKIKKMFSINDHIQKNDVLITDETVIKSSVREWFKDLVNQMVNNLVIVNANVNTNENLNENKIEKVKNKKFTKADFKKTLLQLEVSESHIDDWIKVRTQKRAAFTETALKKIINHCAEKNFPISEAVKICAENSWSGFNHDWVLNLSNKTHKNDPSTETNQQIFERAYHSQAAKSFKFSS